MSAGDPNSLLWLAHAGNHDADAVGRGANAAAFIATDLPGRADRRTAGNTDLNRRVTKDLDATTAQRSADAAAFIAAILFRSTEVRTTRLTRGLLRWAVFVRARLAETHALAAAFIAAVLSRTAYHLIARLTDTEVLGAWDFIGNADATALRATGRPLDAENRRAGVVVDRQANSGAVRAARSGIAAVARIVNADKPFGTRVPGDAAAHATRSRDLRGTSPLQSERNNGARQHRQHAAPGA